MTIVRFRLTWTGFVVLMAVLILYPPKSGARGALMGDPVQGKVLFEKRCTGCHSLDQDMEGPRLRNVYGRKAGSVPGFEYSAALKAANITWDEVLLEKWLADPDSLVSGNDMAFHVPKGEERADIIRFLRVSSGQ